MPSPISILATSSWKTPVVASRSRIATIPLICNPTAAKFPALFRENCLGYDPPAGKSRRKDSEPSAGEMANVASESECGFVLLKDRSPRLDNTTVEPSGWKRTRLVPLNFEEQEVTYADNNFCNRDGPFDRRDRWGGKLSAWGFVDVDHIEA